MRKIIVWLILILLIFLAAKGWWNGQLAAVSSDQATKVFVIKKGESVGSIADRLQKEGLIRSGLAFKAALKLQKDRVHIEAGDFKLSPSMTAYEVIASLSKGSLDKWVTLLEGWRVEEMAQKLNEELGADKEDFLRVAKEGYMFPDTYLFNKEATALDIASVLKSTFNQRLSDDLQRKIQAQGLTVPQGVILASIVEREGRSDGVRTQIAGILLKRFKIGMALNADATIQYALGYQPKEKSWWKRNLTSDDLKITSPFNTYLHAGLPPAPISNPGLASLKAVANADSSTPYLYYYHDSKGNSYYAKTLDEHNRNAAQNP